MIITVKYICRYRLKSAPHYVFYGSRCFNSKTSREIIQVYNKGSIGYNINWKFRSLTALKKELELIQKVKILPF